MKRRMKRNKKPRERVIGLYREFPGGPTRIFRTNERDQMLTLFKDVVDYEGIIFVPYHFRFRSRIMLSEFEKAII